MDEVGYIPFKQDAANLFFQLVPLRYEPASLILTSNLPFARWRDVFGDQVVRHDRPHCPPRRSHHPQGSSYRLKHTQVDSLPSTRLENTAK